MKQKHGLGFPILSDPGNAWASRLGLVFELPLELRELYTAFDIVLPRFNGDDSWELPIPARIVVDTGGLIRGLDADPDYTRRPEPEATLEQLRELSEDR